MFAPKKPVIDSMLQTASDMTRENLRLQQELMATWTRFWPGFTGRGDNPPVAAEGLSTQFFDGINRLTEMQREFVGKQFDAASTAFDEFVNSALATPDIAETPAPEIKMNTTATTPPPEPTTATQPEAEMSIGPVKNILNKVAIVTGAASGIGEAVSKELAKRGAKAVILVDRSEAVNDLAKEINDKTGRTVAEAMMGDTTDEAFRKRVFNAASEKYGIVTICVPAAGITRDSLAVKVDKETGKASLYPLETFRQVTEVNLLAPIYWGMEMVARIAEDRKQRGLKRWEPEEMIQGVVVFLGSVSSQGNKGQISYAVAKAGLEGAAATLTKEAIFHGVRCGIIHPGFTDTPMARSLGEEFLNKYVLPYTQLRRLIKPEEIADAICFMISNSAVSGELWADAGWHPPA